MKKETNLCMGCMGELDEHGSCPDCGHFDCESYISSYLAPKTFLAERYLVGKLIDYCGESALYIGLDTVENRKVTIREYMPDTLCIRERDEEAVTVKPDKLPLYKTYLAEFIELHTTLMNSSNIRCIQPVLDVFSENGTAYVVMDYITGISLKSYLVNCGEIMTWEQIKELFPPVLTALSLLHGMGIIHRGISTSTIFVSEKNELRIIGFSISAARTADSEIGYEVFGGYAPPEQYSSARRNGSWTDVYGISAVLYRCLTGITPPTASERLIEDTLTEPMLINRSIPRNVSQVIMKGMSLEAEDRISTVTEFVDRLFEQPMPSKEDSGEIAVPTPKAPQSRKSGANSTAAAPARTVKKKSSKKKNKAHKDKIKFIVITSILGAIIIAFLIVIIANASGGGEPVETEETTTTAYSPPIITSADGTDNTAQTTPSGNTEGYQLPSFLGTFFSTVSTDPRYSYLVFNATYDFSTEYGAGQIISQSIQPGTTVTSGTEISVIVSKGPDSVPLPDYTGKTAEDYIKELSDLGIKYRTETEETAEVPEGEVARCSVEIGDLVNVAESEEVVVYIAEAPEETTTPEPITEPEETEEPYPEYTDDDNGYWGWFI